MIIIFVVLASVLTGSVCFLIGWDFGEKEEMARWKDIIVAQGHAHYEVQKKPKLGVVFVWNSNSGKTKADWCPSEPIGREGDPF